MAIEPMQPAESKRPLYIFVAVLLAALFAAYSLSGTGETAAEDPGTAQVDSRDAQAFREQRAKDREALKEYQAQ